MYLRKKGIWADHFQRYKKEFEILIKWIIYTQHRSLWVRLCNGGLMQPISTIFQWYHGIRFYFNGWTREYPVKTTDILFVTDNIYYTTLYRVHLITSSRFLIYKMCSRHDIAEILLKLALNTNQSINQQLTIKFKTLLMIRIGVLNYCKFTYHSIATSIHW